MHTNIKYTAKWRRITFGKVTLGSFTYPAGSGGSRSTLRHPHLWAAEEGYIYIYICVPRSMFVWFDDVFFFFFLLCYLESPLCPVTYDFFSFLKISLSKASVPDGSYSISFMCWSLVAGKAWTGFRQPLQHERKKLKLQCGFRARAALQKSRVTTLCIASLYVLYKTLLFTLSGCLAYITCYCNCHDGMLPEPPGIPLEKCLQITFLQTTDMVKWVLIIDFVSHWPVKPVTMFESVLQYL